MYFLAVLVAAISAAAIGLALGAVFPFYVAAPIALIVGVSLGMLADSIKDA